MDGVHVRMEAASDHARGCGLRVATAFSHRLTPDAPLQFEADTADWYDALYYAQSPVDNPTGPRDGSQKVIRGGSYLCHASYCNRYRVAARSATGVTSSTGHMGFRCVAGVS